VWITSYSVGGAIGPLIGGVLLQFFWWGSVFLIAVPVMVLLLVLAPVLLPEYRDPGAGRLDLVSAAMSLIAVLSVIFGLKQIAQDGIGTLAIVSILIGLVVGVAFVRRQLKLQDPLIDLRLFRLPAFSASLATYGLGILVLFGGFLFLPQYLQLVRGLTPLEAGVWTLPWASAFIIGSMVTPPLVRRMNPVKLMAGGMTFASIGFAMLTRVDSDTTFATFAIASFVFSLGFAPAFILTTDLIIGSAPPERAGAASALSETSAEFGGALGIAVFGSIGVALYRGFLVNALPGGMSPEMTDTALSTLGGAIDVAVRLPGEAGMELVAASRAAFLRGVRLCAAISAVGSVALALFAALTLRNIRPATTGPTDACHSS
jgi:DHA2 family multidrug resistance protein-like MFS transporter